MATKKETTKKPVAKKAAAPKKTTTKKVTVKKAEKIVDQTEPQHIGLVLEDWPADAKWQENTLGLCRRSSLFRSSQAHQGLGVP